MGMDPVTLGLVASTAATALGAGVQAYETKRTNKRQDSEAASSIQRQGKIQQEADRAVTDQVNQMAASTAADERTQRLDQYMQALRRGRPQANQNGAAPVGGSTFAADANATRAASDATAAATAGLQARIDAPQLQRQSEAFDYGRLATDLGLIGRESAGQSFVDQLRMRQIRRRPGMDLAAGLITAGGQAAGSAIANRGAPAAGGMVFGNNMDAMAALPGAGRRLPYGFLGG